MPSQYNNRLHRLIARLEGQPFGHCLVNFALGLKIPYLRTSKLKIHKISPEEVVVSIPNKRQVRNHIGQVHAAAMMLLGETASGLLAGINVPEASLPLIKEMRTKFIKRSSGRLTATAKVGPEQDSLFASEKGEILIEVLVTDEAGVQPVLIEAVWAWVPKVKK